MLVRNEIIISKLNDVSTSEHKKNCDDLINSIVRVVFNTALYFRATLRLQPKFQCQACFLFLEIGHPVYILSPTSCQHCFLLKEYEYIMGNAFIFFLAKSQRRRLIPLMSVGVHQVQRWRQVVSLA